MQQGVHCPQAVLQPLLLLVVPLLGLAVCWKRPLPLQMQLVTLCSSHMCTAAQEGPAAAGRPCRMAAQRKQ